MSQKCPLCGKDKADKSLFCKECAVKLNSEYEVNIPELEDNHDVFAEVQSTEVISEQKEAKDVTPEKA